MMKLSLNAVIDLVISKRQLNGQYLLGTPAELRAQMQELDQRLGVMSPFRPSTTRERMDATRQINRLVTTVGMRAFSQPRKRPDGKSERRVILERIE